MVPVLDNVSFCLRRRIRYGAKFDLASSATDTVSTLKLKLFLSAIALVSYYGIFKCGRIMIWVYPQLQQRNIFTCKALRSIDVRAAAPEHD